MTREAIHPGEFLADEIEQIGITATELSRQIDVPPNRISQIIRGKRDLTADTALRLGKFFGTGPEFWINLQKAYELDRARVLLGAKLNKIQGWESVERKAG
jgi:addiction module HigA family antidote